MIKKEKTETKEVKQVEKQSVQEFYWVEFKCWAPTWEQAKAKAEANATVKENNLTEKENV